MFSVIKKCLVICFATFIISSCGGESTPKSDTQSANESKQLTGQSGVKDSESKPNVVQIAVGSKDHTTLVTAVKAGEYVDVLSNVGPFTVFAPINTAFDALPEGTVESLLKPEAKAKLQDILEYHVYVGVIRQNLMRDGMTLNQVNGKNVKLTIKGDETFVNGAKILASVEASNGVVHVIDKVLLPN